MGDSFYKSLPKLAIALLVFTGVFNLVFSDTRYEGPHFVEQGKQFTISCYTLSTAHSKWMKDGEDIVKSSNIEMEEFGEVDNIVKNNLIVKEADVTNAGEYKCNTFDDNVHEIFIITGIGDSDGTPELRGVEVNKRFVLECNVSVSPENTSVGVLWFKNNELINGTSNTHIKIQNNSLEIAKPVDDDWGIYMCLVNAPDATFNRTFEVNIKPRIEPPFPKSVSHIQGESLTLTCNIFGKPTPSVYWLKDGEAITNSNDSRIRIESTDKKSELKIDSLEEDDRAEYTCSINNTVGTANSTILVRVKDKLAALWPFLGIVAEVAVLCTIIFIYEKRRAKQEFEESDTDQSPDTKNVADNKEKDVRQRK